MKKLISILILTISSLLFSQEAKIFKKVNYDELKTIIEKDDGKLYVINFWATWCKPCVEELPHFMEVNDRYKENKDYQMILVSLDHAKSMDSKVKKFLEKNKIDVDVYLLDDIKRMNEWIPAVNPNWSGAIPATAFYKNGQQVHFQELTLTQYELEDIIEENLAL